nr:MAG TPA: hypothetical protein [Caudoviricetes sp.]
MFHHLKVYVFMPETQALTQNGALFSAKTNRLERSLTQELL